MTNNKALEVMPNLNPGITTKQTHILSLPPCCPVSGNPQAGSKIEISYSPVQFHLEVYALQDYINSFVGGKRCPRSGSMEVREMEAMIQTICRTCADSVKVATSAVAHLNLDAGEMIVECRFVP